MTVSMSLSYSESLADKSEKDGQAFCRSDECVKDDPRAKIYSVKGIGRAVMRIYRKSKPVCDVCQSPLIQSSQYYLFMDKSQSDVIKKLDAAMGGKCHR